MKALVTADMFSALQEVSLWAEDDPVTALREVRGILSLGALTCGLDKDEPFHPSLVGKTICHLVVVPPTADSKERGDG